MRLGRIAALTALLALTGCLVPVEPQTSALPNTPAAQSGTEMGTVYRGSWRSLPDLGTGALVEHVTQEGYVERGLPNTALTVGILTNYSCPYCLQLHRGVEGQVLEEFLRRGVAAERLIVLPLEKYPGSGDAAAALLCAGKQGKGFAMHAALTAAESGRHATASAAARTLKLDLRVFEECMNSQETADLVTAQRGWLAERQVTLVPAVMLNGEIETGLPTEADLRGRLEEYLVQMRSARP